MANGRNTIVFFYAIPTAMKNHPNFIVGTALFLGNIPFIIISVLYYPIGDYILYPGVFATSNQMGFTCAAISAGIYIILIGYLSAKKPFSHILFLSLWLGFILSIIFLANSRTSMLCFFIMLSVCVRKLFSRPKYLFNIAKIVILALITLFFYISDKIYLLSAQIGSGLISEEATKSGLSGREIIWQQAIKEARLLGYGGDYFEENFNLGAHNTIISILGKNGIIAASIILCFAVLSFHYAYTYYKNNQKIDDYAIAPLLITICFWLVSMGEGMFGALGNTLTQAYMISVGITMTRRSKKKSSKYLK